MITAVDTSVLLDVLTDAAEHRPASLHELDRARRRGSVVACPVVWAEVRAFFQRDEEMSAFEEAGITFDPFDEQAANLAGNQWQEYRRRGGRRVRLIADFLVAAHAQARADLLLTRDRGFTRRYFENLEILDPSKGRLN